MPIRRLLVIAYSVTVMALLLVVSACAQPGSSGSSSLTALQVLEKAQTSMQQLKAVHLDMNLNESVQTAAQATPTASNGSAPQNISISLQGSGDEVMPDQSAMQIKLNMGGLGSNLQVNEVFTGNKLYLQKDQGQWYVIDQSALGTSGASSFFSATNVSAYNRLLALAQKAQISDHGDETLNGQSLRHISVTFNKTQLSDLISSTGQLPTGLSQDQLNAIQLQQATVDLWIDEQHFYLHRLTLNLKINVDLNGLLQVTPTPTSGGGTEASTLSGNTSVTLDFSKFNESITIQAPASATPTDNPLTIFS
jgi:hypothetical protein